jgi:hypothetical protein
MNEELPIEEPPPKCLTKKRKLCLTERKTLKIRRDLEQVSQKAAEFRQKLADGLKIEIGYKGI